MQADTQNAMGAEQLRAECDACFETASVWPLIERAYSEPQRFYHTLPHLSELFGHLAPYRSDPLWPVIELAVWAHDVVYATDLPDYADNEALSAEWLLRVALDHCSIDWQSRHAGHLQFAAQLIVATKTHRLPDDFDTAPPLQRAAQLFLDANLAILAADPARLLTYDHDIAREWRQAPDAPSDAFRIGRRQALEQLQRQASLFTSVEFEHLEAAARQNLRLLIRRYT